MAYATTPIQHYLHGGLYKEIAAAFGCTSWYDYMQALNDPTRRAELQAIAQGWLEEA